MNKVSAKCFIIDIASIRGTKEEEKLFDFDSQMDQLSECILEDVALSTKIVIGMIMKIMSSKGNSTIILFSRINNERFQNLWENVGLLFKNDNVIQLIGQQSLFYYLGCKMNDFSHVFCISKEQMFFSKDLIETVRSYGGLQKWKSKNQNPLETNSMRFRSKAARTFESLSPKAKQSNSSKIPLAFSDSHNQEVSCINMAKTSKTNSIKDQLKNSIETKDEDIDEEKSENSDRSDPHYEQPIAEEVKTNPDEAKLLQLHQKFETDSCFTKFTSDFIEILETYLKSKHGWKIECMKLVKIVHDLFIQYNENVAKESKNSWINDETKEEYFLHLLITISKKGFLIEETILDFWQRGCKTFQDMNNYCMEIAMLKRLEEGDSENHNKSNIIPSTCDKKAYIQEAYGFIFSAIFKNLKSQNFCQQIDGEEIEKPEYLSIIQDFIDTYSKSKMCMESEKAIIKSYRKFNIQIYNSLVEMRLVSDHNNKIKFHHKEIDNIETP